MLGSIFQTYRRYSGEQYESHKLWATGTCAPSAKLSRQEKTRFETSREPFRTFRARSAQILLRDVQNCLLLHIGYFPESVQIDTLCYFGKSTDHDHGKRYLITSDCKSFVAFSQYDPIERVEFSTTFKEPSTIPLACPPQLYPSTCTCMGETRKLIFKFKPE